MNTILSHRADVKGDVKLLNINILMSWTSKITEQDFRRRVTRKLQFSGWEQLEFNQPMRIKQIWDRVSEITIVVCRVAVELK